MITASDYDDNNIIIIAITIMGNISRLLSPRTLCGGRREHEIDVSDDR